MLFFKPDCKKLLANNDIEGLIAVLERKCDNKLYDQATEALIKIGALATGPLSRAYHKNLNTAYSIDKVKIRRRIISVISALKDPKSIDTLIDALTDDPLARDRYNLEDTIRRIAVDTLISLGEASVEPLLHYFDHPRGTAQEEVIFILGHIGDKRAFDKILKVLLEGHSVETSITALTNLDGPGSTIYLCKILDENRFWDEHKIVAIGALGKIKDPCSLDSLMRIVLQEKKSHPNGIETRLKRSATAAIKSICQNNTDYLSIFLDKENDNKIREIAVDLLGSIDNDKTIDLLLKVMNDDDERIRKNAVYYLQKKGYRDWFKPA